MSDGVDAAAAPVASDTRAADASVGAGSRVTAAVLTYNEARHLPDCLASVAWADHVLVVDSGSTDGTVALAEAAGAETVEHAFVDYAKQRQFALGRVRSPWVLFVDADERVPGELAREVRAACAVGDAAGYWIPRRNVFWGHRLRGGGWWPDHQLRLLRVSRASYAEARAVHEVASVDGPTGELEAALLHLNYESWAEFRAKQRAYVALEIERRRAAGWRFRPHQLVTQPLRELRRRYLTLGGWRDGGLGLLLAGHMAWYELRTVWGLRGGR